MKTSYLAIYFRILDDDGYMEQDKIESASIESQRGMLQYFISKNNKLSEYPVKEFLGDGFSGGNFNRPDIQKLLREVREGKVSCIIVKDLSQIGRNYIEVGDYIEQIFPFLGVQFLSVTDNYDNFKNPKGIEIGFKNLIPDLYSRDLSKKIKSVNKLIPANMIAYRSQYGSIHPTEIIGSALIAILFSTVVGIIFSLIARKNV